MSMKIYDKGGSLLLDIEVDDTSFRYKVIKGENSLTLKFSLDEHMEIPVGSYCVFKNERYCLMQTENLNMKHRRYFEYSLLMHTEDAKARQYKFRNPVDGRLKFSLTAKPKEHLKMFVDNMNMRDSGWKVGECPDDVEIPLSYNHTWCSDALSQLADELKLDYWYVGKTVNIGKLELYKDTPLPLSYGGDGEGLNPDIKRNNPSDALPVEILFVEGGEKNIDFSKYGRKELHLPFSQTIGYDGEHFSDEGGFNSSNARYYTTDEDGYFIRRDDKALTNGSEDSLDCTFIEPTKEETVHEVIEDDAEKHFYDILFESNVDYKEYQIGGEKATIVFQSGMLAGKEFDLAVDSNDNLICEKQEESGLWRMEIVPQDIDGITMPDAASKYLPKKDDKFKIFGIQLPDKLLVDNENKSGAEWEMFRYAVKHMYLNEDPQYSITGELNEIYAKKNWDSISPRITLGSYISFTDQSFQKEPLLIRIVGIKDYVNKPYSPKLEISNAAVSGSLLGSLNRMENQEAYAEERHKQGISFTKRQWRDAKETISMLQAAMKGFSEGVNPITIETMAILVGDKLLQYVFTKSLTSDETEEFAFTYDDTTGIITFPESYIKHMTYGIDSISPVHDSDEYRRWLVPSITYTLEKDKAYYIYAYVSKSDSTAQFVVVNEYQEETEDYLYLLVGILNASRDGERAFSKMYGFTEVLPGQIQTGLIRSEDGSCYFDLNNNEIGGIVHFKAGSTGDLNIGNQNMLRNSGFTGDYLSEPLADETVMDSVKDLYSAPLDHWTATEGVTVVALESVSASGFGVEIAGSGDSISQELYHKTIKDETYMFSFKAKSAGDSGSVKVICGGVENTIAVTSEWKRYTVKVVAVETGNAFSLSGAGLTVCELQLERGTIATSWGNSPFDNNSDRAYYQSLQYIADALKGMTTIDGGLILTRMIRLGEGSNQTEFVEKAGVNGIHGGDDNSPAFWSGGTLETAIATIKKYTDNPSYRPTDAEVADMARFVVTHGGRAILNDVIVRGTVYSQSGFFGGRLQMPFVDAAETCDEGYSTSLGMIYSLTEKSASHIAITRDRSTSLKTLYLPNNEAFDGWVLDVFALPAVEGFSEVRIAGDGIALPLKIDKTGSFIGTKSIKAEGGYLRFANVDGIWYYLNEKDALQDEIAVVDVTSDTGEYDLTGVKKLIVSSNATSAALYCNLPANPYDGEEITVITPFDSGVVVTSDKLIIDLQGGVDAHRKSINGRGELRFTYLRTTDKWMCLTTVY